MKWFKRILIALLSLIALILIAGYFWLNSSKPEYEGTVPIKGIRDSVDVHFDDYGVPHIYAQNKHDLYMTFGYIHAQDRLFQMELLRRAGSGRLSEIIGRPMLKVDRMFRTLGLTEYARESAAYMETQKGSPIYEDITAYLEGVNYFMQNGPTPPEFSLIGIEKVPFTIEDLYTITGAMSFSFSQAQRTEPVIDFISKNYGDEYLDDIGLWHDSTESYIRTFDKIAPRLEQPASHQNGEILISENQSGQEVSLAMAKAMSEMEELLPFAPLEGSNSWVVGGKKTENGDVLFCNDTHIGYLIPQTWYEAHLDCPGFEMYGHFMAGIPFALVGRNRSLSWGLTMLLNDDMDFYYERNSESNPDQFIYNGESEKCTRIPHVIKIKGEADTTIEVRITRHGPVINDAFDGMESGEPISMFWTYTHLPNRTVDAFYGMNNATDMEDFRSFLPMIHAPGLNVNYGDKEGNIAWWGCASLIKRPKNVNSWTILDGTTGADDNLGYYPFSYNPKCINPEWGYIYSANDWPQASPEDSLWYPGYYKPQYRADRIRALLESKNDWTMESIQDVMTDHVNLSDSAMLAQWATLLHANKKFSDSAYFQQFYELFEWNGSYEPMESSPTFFNKMLYHYLHETLADELGEERFKLFLETHQVQRTQQHLFLQEKSPWWDNKQTPEVEKREDIIYIAFCKSISDLTEQLGNNPRIWNWRKVTTLELRHPLGEVALFRPLFNVGPHAVYGGNETILQSGFKLDPSGEYKVFYGSQMRIIVDFADVDSSLNITPCGQSGHIMSSHYNDQAKKYRQMKFRTQWMNRKRIQQFEKLTITPG